MSINSGSRHVRESVVISFITRIDLAMCNCSLCKSAPCLSVVSLLRLAAAQAGGRRLCALRFTSFFSLQFY